MFLSGPQVRQCANGACSTADTALTDTYFDISEIDSNVRDLKYGIGLIDASNNGDPLFA